MLSLSRCYLFTQRRRCAEDELTMRSYLQEGDLISVTPHSFTINHNMIVVYNILTKFNYKPQYDIVVQYTESFTINHNMIQQYNILLNLLLIIPAPGFNILSACSVLQAEVQSVYADGALLLHTRSLKYGKVSCCNYTVVIRGPTKSVGTLLYSLVLLLSLTFWLQKL